ncbi:MAG: hypothetical protein CME06_02645 [Gemmatimonadetes bacterium]|nr:hypothetical protein [Gemmatimonadota bacterium]
MVIIEEKIAPADLAPLVAHWFGDMVKYVVDIDRRIVAIGGELHSDAEQILLDRGSEQARLWGANYYPALGEEECIEYTALINIRPTQGNPGMLIGDESVRRQVRAITFDLIGRGEALP